MHINNNKNFRRSTLTLAACFLTALTGCDKPAHEVEMKIDQVDELRGMILKGISITGAITKGCLANDDEYRVLRDGEEIHTNTVRILNIRDLKDPDAFDGKAYLEDYVTLYIPDGQKGDVKPGDVLVSDRVSISCDRPPAG